MLYATLLNTRALSSRGVLGRERDAGGRGQAGALLRQLCARVLLNSVQLDESDDWGSDMGALLPT